MNKYIFCLLISALPFRQMHAQIITTVAGTGVSGFFGDGGPATLAQFVGLGGLTMTQSGAMVVADWHGFRFRIIDPSGTINTLAGTGTNAYVGDGSPATAASVCIPRYACADTAGNIYLSSSYNVRKVNTANIITNYAGNIFGACGTYVPSPITGFGGPATGTQLRGNFGVAVDRAGSLYICLRHHYEVVKVTAAGTLEHFAGNGSSGSGGDGGPATAAQLTPIAIATDTIGNVYIVDQAVHNVRKVDLTGTITTIAGNGGTGYTGDGGPATGAEINTPTAIAVDYKGNIYIPSGHAVRMIAPSGIISRIAGNPSTPGFAGDNNLATVALLAGTEGLACDCAGNLYLTDRGNGRIRKVAFDDPPVFAMAVDSISMCKDAAAYPLNSLLTIADTDTGQTETWKIVTMPLHGTLTGATYSTTTAGLPIAPTGYSYTPAIGYTGRDTVRFCVTDCSTDVDTITIAIRVDDDPVAGTISGLDTVCDGSTITLSATAAVGGAWSTVTGNATVAAGTVTGNIPGTDTVRYIVTNACGADTTSHAVQVKLCNTGVAQLTAAAIQVFPNPAAGKCTLLVPGTGAEEINVVITSATGARVWTGTVTANKATVIDLAPAAGVYLVTAQWPDGSSRSVQMVR